MFTSLIAYCYTVAYKRLTAEKPLAKIRSLGVYSLIKISFLYETSNNSLEPVNYKINSWCKLAISTI